MRQLRLGLLIVIPLTVLIAANANGQSPQSHLPPQQIHVRAEAPTPGLFFAGPIPRTKFIAEDATLNDVCSVGDKCWAVGERGVVVRSEDAGVSWQASVLSAECSLKSICFLTNQIGFVAGSSYHDLDHRRQSVLLTTRDGGDTWRPLSEENGSNALLAAGFTAANSLPPLSYVRFFDLENAIVIGRPDAVGSPGQVFRSQDGGKSWKALAPSTEATPSAHWTSGAFLSAKDGVVVGQGNALGAVVSDQLVALQQPINSLQQIRAASLTADGNGWLAGDSAFLQQTTDGGITWKPIASALPPKMNEVLDFHAICHRGNIVCAAGSPGSLVLQSTDGGTSWFARKVPNSPPINAMSFVGESTVIAVGPFGMIHRSSDSGTSWTGVRNSGHRSSVLCLTTNPDDVSFRMLSTIAGNEGFRTVVAQPSARLSNQTTDDTLLADRMASVVPQLGGNVFTRDWMFARTQPLQNTVSSELLKAWEQQSDGRVRELLPQRLAQLIRTWRPDVVCIESASKDDQVAVVWTQAISTAQRIATGQDHRSQTLDSAGLEPWTVKRLVVRERENTSSPLSFSGESLLTNIGTLTDLVANHGRHQLASSVATPDSPQQRRSPSDSYVLHNSTSDSAVAHMLAGIMSAPGTESRRMLTNAAADQREQLLRLTQQARQQRAVLASQAQHPAGALNLIAQLKDIGTEFPDRLAMQQLLSLSEMYEAVENLDGQIAVLKEITERFPDTAEAADANELLFHYYSSAELRFLRRQTERKRQVSLQSPQQNNSLIQQVGGTIPGIAKLPVIRNGEGQTLFNPQGKASTAVDERWNANADAALQQLHRLSPERSSAPQLSLRHAANLRMRQDENRSNTILSQAGSGDGPFAMLARAEMQAVFGAASTPIPVINLKKSLSKPFLDSKLIDGIWEEATEIALATVGQPNLSTNRGCLIMLGWDDDHVYLSGRVERVASRDYQMDRTASRTHDSTHGIRDRIEFSFDTDRDYTTAFHFTIDEAGQTSERCWRSRRWNPEWFVAAELDDESWRFEIAIPQEELVDQAVRPGDLWAIRIHRVVPGVLEQTLRAPESDSVSTDTSSHGLLRFIRRR